MGIDLRERLIMSDKDIAPGRVLDGFQSLIFSNDENDATPSPTSEKLASTETQVSESAFQKRNERQEKLTEHPPRRLPQFFRKS